MNYNSLLWKRTTCSDLVLGSDLPVIIANMLPLTDECKTTISRVSLHQVVKKKISHFEPVHITFATNLFGLSQSTNLTSISASVHASFPV